MPLETLENQEEKESSTEGAEMKGLMAILTPEGLLMMPIAVIFDLASIICTILIMAYGIGYIAGIVVDVIALAGFSLWSLIRGKFKKMTVETGEKATGSNISLPQRPARETGKEARIGEEVEKATKIGKAAQAGKAAKVAPAAAKVAPAAAKVAKFAKWARWGKIITPLKNRIPGAGLIPTWTPTVYFELQS